MDLRHLCICSVDPPGCTDIDDALHCRLLPNKNFEVHVIHTLLTAVHAGCLQLLEICWNLVDSPGKFYNWQCNFYLSGDFLITLYIGSPRVNRITMFSGVSIPAW